MEEQNESGFNFYSLGIVVTAKVKDSDLIDVDPIERLTMDNGKLTADSKKYDTSLPDQHGVAQTAKLEGGSVITAKWVPFGDSNRETSPDVQPSETVLLFRYADTQDYYWTTIFREPKLRRQEKVIYVYSNQKSGLKPYDSKTSYWVEVNTIDKRVKLHTSSNDGEPVDYDIEIDTKRGIFSLSDDAGNSLTLESTKGRLSAEMKTEIILKAPSVKIEASGSVEITSPTLKASGNIKAGGTVIDTGGNTPHHSH